MSGSWWLLAQRRRKLKKESLVKAHWQWSLLIEHRKKKLLVISIIRRHLGKICRPRSHLPPPSSFQFFFTYESKPTLSFSTTLFFYSTQTHRSPYLSLPLCPLDTVFAATTTTTLPPMATHCNSWNLNWGVPANWYLHLPTKFSNKLLRF